MGGLHTGTGQRAAHLKEAIQKIGRLRHNELTLNGDTDRILRNLTGRAISATNQRAVGIRRLKRNSKLIIVIY